MRNDEYAVFEPVHVSQNKPEFRRLSREQFENSTTKLSLPGAGRLRPESVRTVNSLQAEAERATGKTVLRIPKMPLRLIPQVSAQEGEAPGEPWGIAAIGADRTGDLRGEGVCVAVLDTGVDASHPAFAGLIREDNYQDFTGTGKQDTVGHGTHCAGIIFGRPINGKRIAVAPGITRVLIGKIADSNFSATTTLLQTAMMWAVNAGADIISLSIGLDFIGHSQQLQRNGFPPNVAMAEALNDYRDYTRFFDRLMGMVVSAGSAARSALVVAACGNDSNAVRDGVRVPATLPAVAENVLAVGALGRAPGGTFSVASYSNSSANVCGPGAGILSARPGGSTATMSGTSQAAPHVAGAAALWLQKLRLDRDARPAPADVRLELLAAAQRAKVVGQDDFDAIGRGMAMVPNV